MSTPDSHSAVARLTLLGRHADEDLAAKTLGGDVNRAQVLVHVGAVAAALPNAPADSPVALISVDRYRFAVGLLAIWSRGYKVVLPPNGQVQTVETVVGRTEAIALLHDTDNAGGVDLRAAINSVDLRGNRVDARAEAPVIQAAQPPVFDDQHVIATVFTSGSTGAFTAVDKTAAQLFNEVACLAQTLAVGPGHTIVATVPPHHIYGLLFSVLLPLSSGAVLSHAMPHHAESVAAAVRSVEATHLISVPAHLRGLQLLEPGALGDLGTIISSTAPLPAATADMVWDRHAIAVTEILGSTETGGIAWRKREATSSWRPFDGITITIDDEGRLHVDSSYLPADWPRPFATQDRVKPDGSGGFVHLGRIDSVVKIGGTRLSLAQMRSKLLAIGGVHDAEVVAVDGPGGRSKQVMAVIVAPEHTARSIKSALLQWFQPVQVPRRILVVDCLPREDTGKLPRAKVLALLGRDDAPTDVLDVEVLRHETDGDRHMFVIDVPDNLVYFRGHFPEGPVLPGVSILHDVVLRRIDTAWPGLGHPTSLANVKFRKTLHPSDRLYLTLTRKSDSRIDFKLVRGDDVCASGRLLWESA